MRSGSVEAPHRGDLVWLDFDPVAGHEQGGRRPALVLSSRKYNRLSGLMLACPVTSKPKGYAFEVHVEVGKVAGVVLCDHVKNVSWRERGADLIGRVESGTLAEVTARIVALVESD
ncbi:endoribonuclease MazF [bacterium]|nr:MAG: endoribonuclease MazF [bacterium]